MLSVHILLTCGSFIGIASSNRVHDEQQEKESIRHSTRSIAMELDLVIPMTKSHFTIASYS